MTRNYRDDLRLIRPYTGKHFTKAHGYSASTKPNFGQRMAVYKYARKVEEMLTVPSTTMKTTPRNRELVYRETGQEHFPLFTKAIIAKPPVPEDVRYSVDYKRPRGSQLVATGRDSGRNYFHIPAEYFLESEEIDTEFYADIIQEYAEQAEFFLIQAGQSYMWGSATGSGGTLDGVTKKIAEIFRNYSSTMFDANDKNSSYYGNWFRGVTAFTSVHDAMPKLGEALERQESYRHRFQTGPFKRREARFDAQGIRGPTKQRYFENGELLQGWHRLSPARGEAARPKGQNLWGHFVDGVLIEREWNGRDQY